MIIESPRAFKNLDPTLFAEFLFRNNSDFHTPRTFQPNLLLSKNGAIHPEDEVLRISSGIKRLTLTYLGP